MTSEQIMNQLRDIIADNLDLEIPETIKESDRIFEDLGIDSIMVLQTVVYIEENFDVSIPEDEVDPAAFETIGSLVQFIEKLHKEQNKENN